MTDKEQIIALEDRVKALENTVAELQKQVVAMPRNIQQQMARSASRRLS
jgi:uncharacterized coiled-coil protein SlyX